MNATQPKYKAAAAVATGRRTSSTIVGSAQSRPAYNGSMADHPEGHESRRVSTMLLFAAGHRQKPAAPQTGTGIMKLKPFEQTELSAAQDMC